MKWWPTGNSFWTFQPTRVEELNTDPTDLALLSKTQWKLKVMFSDQWV